MAPPVPIHQCPSPKCCNLLSIGLYNPRASYSCKTPPSNVCQTLQSGIDTGSTECTGAAGQDRRALGVYPPTDSDLAAVGPGAKETADTDRAAAALVICHEAVGRARQGWVQEGMAQVFDSSANETVRATCHSAPWISATLSPAWRSCPRLCMHMCAPRRSPGLDRWSARTLSTRL